MIIIRGKITEAVNKISLTCCDTTDNILIDGKSLFHLLEEHFDLYVPREDDMDRDIEKIDSNIGVSYLILDKDPGNISDYQTFFGEWIIRKLYSAFVSGCYSEMTCGPGTYDYFFGDDGHNIGTEFSCYIGKYVILRIDDKRNIVIDSILNDNE